MSPQPGSLPFVICIILKRRGIRPMPVERIATLAKAEPEAVSTALQRLKTIGLAKMTDTGWLYGGRKQ